MIEVVVTYNNDFGGTPYNAASIKTQTSNINEALNYAFRYTQNTDGSWSKKIGSDANDKVEVLHYRNDGYGLRSSMVGDTFTIWFDNKEYKKFKCMPIGFKEVA